MGQEVNQTLTATVKLVVNLIAFSSNSTSKRIKIAGALADFTSFFTKFPSPYFSISKA